MSTLLTIESMINAYEYHAYKKCGINVIGDHDMKNWFAVKKSTISMTLFYYMWLLTGNPILK